MSIIVKGLSVRQPWASYIAIGKKTVEWRSWRTNYRGPLLICSSSQYSQGNAAFCKANPKGFPLGSAVGLVTIVDCVPFKPKHLAPAMCLKEGENPDLIPDSEVSGYAWLLENPALIDVFPVKGKVGFMNVEIPDGIGWDREDVYKW